MRIFCSTSRYPAYDHVSYNLEQRFERVTLLVTFHVRHAWGGGGFWLGLRPEIEVRRVTDEHMALRQQMSKARAQSTCTRCGRQEWGEPGLRGPTGWEFISRMDFCDDCVGRFTYKELLAS